jgi:hypothetical protein
MSADVPQRDVDDPRPWDHPGAGACSVRIVFRLHPAPGAGKCWERSG